MIAGDDLFAEVERFAKKIARLDDEALKRKTTVLDLDWKRNDNLRDPLALSDRRGVIHPRGHGDRQTDNDGLFQRFTGSCGPSVIQMMLVSTAKETRI